MFVHRLANEFIDRGNQATVYTFAERPPHDARYEMRRLARAAIGNTRASRYALGPITLHRIGAQDIDVLNLHGDDWFYLRRRVPTVRTFHGSALREAQAATHWKRKALQSVLYAGEMAASRLATASYTVCAGMPRGYRLSGTLPQGIGLRPSGTPAERRFSDPTILFVGTWSGRKRGRFLRDAFERDVVPRLNSAQLIMVSDYCEESPNVQWIQYPDDRLLSRLYARSWLFCMPSTYEGFGQPYVEAMAHGTPVVATTNPGFLYVTENGGCAVTANDDDLGRRLADLLDDAHQRERLTTLGLKRAEGFTWDAACDAHLAAFSGAIETFRTNA